MMHCNVGDDTCNTPYPLDCKIRGSFRIHGIVMDRATALSYLTGEGWTKAEAEQYIDGLDARER